MVRTASSAVHSEALDVLEEYLASRGYDPLGRHFIKRSLLEHDTLANAVADRLLHPAHEAAATELVVTALGEFPFESPAWDIDDDRWVPSADDMGEFLDGIDDEPFGPSAQDDRERLELLHGRRFAIVG